MTLLVRLQERRSRITSILSIMVCVFKFLGVWLYFLHEFVRVNRTRGVVGENQIDDGINFNDRLNGLNE